MDWTNKGLKIDGEYLNHLRFSDDIVLIANSPEELQVQIHELNTASNKVGLKMNLAKTKVTYQELVERKDILINNTRLKILEEYI